MQRREFLFTAAAALSPERVLPVRIGGSEFTALYWGENWDKPFLYPIRTASGKLLSRGYPLAPRPGDSNDHPWHRGIWWGHGNVNGVDLWREQGRTKTGRLVVEGVPALAGQTLSLRAAMASPEGRVFGHADLRFDFRGLARLRIVDAAIAIAADQGAPLVFGDTDDGGFAFRLAEVFREDRGAQLCNSEGGEGSKQIWGKAARWVDYSALVDGSPAGVACFDHPSNLRHPTRWHARPYGLCSANPFAVRGFTGSGDGAYTVAAGATLRLRYRVVIHEGRWEREDAEAHYQEFARS